MKPEDFWDWFADHAAQIEAAAQSTTGSGLHPLLAELDGGVRAMDPGIGWEIGPRGEGWFLALSPKGSREALAKTVELVQCAPADVEGWEFLPAKPPKEWARKFQYGPKQVDASGWRYQLRRWDDGALGVLWGITDIDMDSRELDGLGWFVLESELGEEVVVRNFVDVEVTRLSEWDEPKSGGEIGVLRAHVAKLLQANSGEDAG